MTVFQIGGDPNYIGITYQSVEEVAPLRQLEFDHAPLDPAHVVNIGYAFKEPEEEGVITDCPYSGLGSTLVLRVRLETHTERPSRRVSSMTEAA